MKKFFHRLDKAGTPVADPSGAIWLEFANEGESSRIGLSANNLASPGTDSEVAYRVVLARIGHVLQSPKHGRESMVEFKKDWDLMQAVRTNRASALARAATAAGPGGGSFLNNE